MSDDSSHGRDSPVGLLVWTADGRRLGTVTAADDEEMAVQQGLIVTRTYILPLTAVERFVDGVLVLKLTMEQAKVAQDSPPR